MFNSQQRNSIKEAAKNRGMEAEFIGMNSVQLSQYGYNLFVSSDVKEVTIFFMGYDTRDNENVRCNNQIGRSVRPNYDSPRQQQLDKEAVSRFLAESKSAK